METEACDRAELSSLLQNAVELNNYATVETGHCNRTVGISSDDSACQCRLDNTANVVTLTLTSGQSVGVYRKQPDQNQICQQREAEADYESIVKIRLFVTTTVLWFVWLVVYVTLWRWRFF